jgi:hypothetical protein
MIPDEEDMEEHFIEPTVVYWTWTEAEYIDDLWVRRVQYLRPSDIEPQLLVSPIPEVPAEWTTPLIDRIDADRADVCDVVCLMWLVGLGNTETLTPIRYISPDDFDVMVVFRQEQLLKQNDKERGD